MRRGLAENNAGKRIALHFINQKKAKKILLAISVNNARSGTPTSTTTKLTRGSGIFKIAQKTLTRLPRSSMKMPLSKPKWHLVCSTIPLQPRTSMLQEKLMTHL